MPSNQTEHYGLNQWSLTDGVLMADFNRDNQLIDSALDTLHGNITASVIAAESRLNTSMTALERNLTTSVSSLDKNLSDLDRNVTVVQDDLASTTADVFTLKSDTSTLQTDVRMLFEFVAALDTAITQLSAQIPTVQSDSYVGTGTYNSDAPNTLTFSFSPKLVIINQSTGQSASSGLDWFRFIAVRGSSLCYAEFSDNIYSKPTPIYLTWGENSLSWYATTGAQQQGNTANVTYHYTAIG